MTRIQEKGKQRASEQDIGMMQAPLPFELDPKDDPWDPKNLEGFNTAEQPHLRWG